MTQGIYRITHIATQRHYVGSSVNLERRKKEHWTRLKNKSHPARHLSASFEKYGADAFEFVILEECDCTDEKARYASETQWIQAIQPVFNVAPVAGSVFGLKRSEEARANMARAQKERYQASGGSTLRGRSRPQHVRDSIAAAHKGKTLTAEHIANMSAALKGRISPRKGVTLSAETKAKISAGKRGVKQSPENVMKREIGKLKAKLARLQDKTE